MVKHTAKFTPPQNHFFLRGPDSMAYVIPSYPESVFPDDFIKYIRTITKTVGEWKALFAGYMELQADTPVGQGFSPVLERITLKTPKRIH
jgi:hypothetical protein